MQKLADNVVEELRSNFNIYNQGQAIEELVLNSVDANATVIEVFADTHNFAFEVRDNGDGMSVEDLELIGKRHGIDTSHNLKQYY
jgi:DNA mismatch repair ATPase MutL